MVSEEAAKWFPHDAHGTPQQSKSKSTRDLWRAGGGLSTHKFADVVQDAMAQREAVRQKLSKNPRHRHYDLLLSLSEQGQQVGTREGVPPQQTP